MEITSSGTPMLMLFSGLMLFLCLSYFVVGKPQFVLGIWKITWFLFLYTHLNWWDKDSVGHFSLAPKVATRLFPQRKTELAPVGSILSENILKTHSRSAGSCHVLVVLLFYLSWLMRKYGWSFRLGISWPKSKRSIKGIKDHPVSGNHDKEEKEEKHIRKGRNTLSLSVSNPNCNSRFQFLTFSLFPNIDLKGYGYY